MDGFEWLDDVSKNLNENDAEGASPVTLTVREFIGKFGYLRRGKRISVQILNKLDELDLVTDPSFDRAWLDSTISIRLDQGRDVPRNRPDPTVRVGILKAANTKPVSVKPNNPLSVATTIMQMRDFSQLPVMTGSHSVKGVVSWKSIGARVALGHKHESVDKWMDPPVVIDITTPLFDTVDVVQRHDYVLVKNHTNEITGIVTASDITQQFKQLSAEFLFVGEIEGRLRNLIHGKFTTEELRGIWPDPKDSGRISGPADLTFGDYVQLLGNEDNWKRLDLTIDRREFVKQLDSVREVRNDVMHFDPEGLDPEQIEKLKEFAEFFRYMASIGAV